MSATSQFTEYVGDRNESLEELASSVRELQKIMSTIKMQFFLVVVALSRCVPSATVTQVVAGIT